MLLRGYFPDHKNQRDMISPRGHSELPVTDSKEMEMHELPDDKFKIIFLKLPRELQEDMDKQFNKIRKTIQKQHERFNKKKKKH